MTLKPRILIVDDEKNVRDALLQWFDVRGFATDLAQDGIEAVEKCTRREYDVVTMDLEMPGMNGAEAITLIKRNRPDLPIVVLTGYAPSGYGEALNGAARVLSKPISLVRLEEVIRQVMCPQTA